MTYSTHHKQNFFNPKYDWIWVIIALIIFCACFAFTGCSPQKKLNRLLSKHPELTTETKVTITDTLFLTSTSVDTIFSTSVDTVVLTNDSIKITYIKVKDKIYLKGETMKVPVIVTKEVMVKSPVITKTIDRWYHKPLLWFSLFMFLLLIFLVLRKTITAYLKTLPWHVRE